jgi:anti-sigma B factor antagonist
VRLRNAGASHVVALPTRIDITNAGRVAVQLMAAVGGGARVVAADLVGTGFCDSAGVHLLLQVSRRAAERGVEVRLAAARDPVLRMLDLMAANRSLRLYPEVSAALAETAVFGP